MLGKAYFLGKNRSNSCHYQQGNFHETSQFFFDWTNKDDFVWKTKRNIICESSNLCSIFLGEGIFFFLFYFVWKQCHVTTRITSLTWMLIFHCFFTWKHFASHTFSLSRFIPTGESVEEIFPMRSFWEKYLVIYLQKRADRICRLWNWYRFVFPQEWAHRFEVLLWMLF